MGGTGFGFMARWWQLFWTMESQGEKLHTKHEDTHAPQTQYECTCIQRNRHFSTHRIRFHTNLSPWDSERLWRGKRERGQRGKRKTDIFYCLLRYLKTPTMYNKYKLCNYKCTFYFFLFVSVNCRCNPLLSKLCGINSQTCRQIKKGILWAIRSFSTMCNDRQIKHINPQSLT